VFGVVGLSAACLAITTTPAAAYQGIPAPTVQTFSQCPVNGSIGAKDGHVTTCVVGDAQVGSIDIAGLDTTFKGPGLVQFGFAGDSGVTVNNTVGALDGQSFTAPRQLLSKPAMTLLGNPAGVTPPAQSQVYIQTELAGPITFNIITPGQGGLNPETIIPLVFKVENPVVGPNCTLGTLADPIVLTLTTGMSGALTGTLGTLNFTDNGNLGQTIGTEVVDGVFSVPGATGCGSGGVFDNDIDAANALPSPSGSNQAMLFGSFDLAASRFIKHALHE
jgi:hypothetical protein